MEEEIARRNERRGTHPNSRFGYQTYVNISYWEFWS